MSRTLAHFVCVGVLGLQLSSLISDLGPLAFVMCGGPVVFGPHCGSSLGLSCIVLWVGTAALNMIGSAPLISVCKLCCTSSCVYVDLWTFYPLHTRLFGVMRPAALFVVRPADLLLFVWCIGSSVLCIIAAAISTSVGCISAALAAPFRYITPAPAALFRCRA